MQLYVEKNNEQAVKINELRMQKHKHALVYVVDIIMVYGVRLMRRKQPNERKVGIK